MNTLYKKTFEFTANGYEEYQNGKLINFGVCDCKISTEVKNSVNPTIRFKIIGRLPQNINSQFTLPILGSDDILEDRIQYGRLPILLQSDDPDEPIVCNIFNNLKCIRFAMLSPLRIIEFYGSFTLIQ